MRRPPPLTIPNLHPHPHLTHLTRPLRLAIRRAGVPFTPYILTISVLQQRMHLHQQHRPHHLSPLYRLNQRFLISTSTFGTGQNQNSHQTPLGLHHIARKIGGGHITGTVFRNRLPVGFTWQGIPHAPIAHRILWLQGLQPGTNAGPQVDTFKRYIYIHGTADECTLGKDRRNINR